ncbi:MAG TPA: hypothetical protein VFO16_24115 [Pseudonocardiaceae bacterium]|nr:hypothetical protein [Pseudonocardiaceae bacterium]
MLLSLDGPDNYDTAHMTTTGKWTNVGQSYGPFTTPTATPTIQTTGGRLGKGCLRFDGTSTNAPNNGWAGIALTPGDNRGSAGFWWKASAWPSSRLTFFMVYDATTPQLSLCVEGGHLVVMRGSRSGTQLAYTNWTLATGADHYYELMWVIHNTAGLIDLQIDGASVPLYAVGSGALLNGVPTLNTRNSANSSWNILYYNIDNSAQVGGQWFFRDFYRCDGVGGLSFLGDVVVSRLPRLTDGNYTMYTPSAAGSHSALVDEAPATDDTDYIESVTPGDKDSGNYTIPAGTLAVVFDAYGRKTDATVRGFHAFRRSGTTDYPFGSDQILSTSYQYFGNNLVLPTDPATGLPWVAGTAELGVTTV